ncbi:MAG: hypothetical protein AAGD00_06910 [Planctomycetota bacterium]
MLGIFLSTAVLIMLALLATSAPLYRLRRSRPMLSLLSGGWLWLAAGVAVGPFGAGLVSEDALVAVRPFTVILLGWIGCMVGLQVRPALLEVLTRDARRTIVFDVVSSLVLTSAAAWLLIEWWTGGASPSVIAQASLVLAAGACGWSSEGRSVGLAGGAPGAGRARRVLALGGLVGVLAVAIAGVGTGFGDGPYGKAGAWIGSAWAVGVSLVVGVCAATVGRVALRSIPGTGGAGLVVFIGVLATAAGLSAQLGVMPMLATLICGIFIANTGGKDARAYERFILKSEHLIAALFGIVAGVSLSLAIGVGGVALACALVGVRVAIKPIVVHEAWRFEDREEARRGVARTGLAVGAIRPSSLALALVLGLAIAKPSDLHNQLIGVVALAGLLCEVLSIVSASLLLRERARGAEGAP